MNWLAVAIAVVTVIRLIVAAAAPLAPDETYYWIWSHALAGGYLDHPPMVALWIRGGTALAGQTALGVRLAGPLAAAVASWMIFDAAKRLFPGTKSGVVAVLLLNASLLLGVGTVIMTPDSPLLFFWTATLWAMARIATGGTGSWWLASGVFAGLALDSKYTGLFLWIGVGLWVVLVPSVRPWLRRWHPWAAAGIGFGLFAPVVVWNFEHAWAGFIRQGGRTADWHPARALGFLAELVGGQIGLATPLVWVLCMMGLVASVRIAWRSRDPRWSLLAALSLPAVLVFTQHAIGDRVQGNWPAIIYPALAVAAGGLGVSRRWWGSASALGFGITGLAYVQATTELIPFPPKLDPVAMRLKGWDKLAGEVGSFRGGAFVAADGYALASELAWWLPPAIPVVGTDERWRLFDLPSVDLGSKSGLLIRDAGRADQPDPVMWRDVRLVAEISRPDTAGRAFEVYRVTGAGQAAALPAR